MQQLALVLLVVCWSWCVQAYGNGKVSVACGDMEPQHGYAPSSDPPPYNITVNTSTFTPGDRITVTLRAPPSGSAYFKGFLIEARDAGRPDAAAVGSFALLDPAESRLLRCGDVQARVQPTSQPVSGPCSTRVRPVFNPPLNLCQARVQPTSQPVPVFNPPLNPCQARVQPVSGPCSTRVRPVFNPSLNPCQTHVQPTSQPLPMFDPPLNPCQARVRPTSQPVPVFDPPPNQCQALVQPTSQPVSDPCSTHLSTCVRPVFNPPLNPCQTSVRPMFDPPLNPCQARVQPTSQPVSVFNPPLNPCQASVQPTSQPVSGPCSTHLSTRVRPMFNPPLNPCQAHGSGVSHRRSSRKTQVQTVWESPKQNPPQRVQFLVTVVQKYTVYWVRIQGPVVSVDGATPPPATPPTATPPETTATPPETTSPAAALTTAFSSEGCGSRKSCLRDPVGCQPESDPRCFFLSFSSDAAGGSVTFELSGPADGYVAFALSLDKWMGNDDVYLCVSDGGSVSINAAYVSGRTHPELEEEALWDRAWRLDDGVIQCRFHRNVVLSHMENRFDLNQSYFLFLAHGRAQRGFIHRHDRQPLISTDRKVITGSPEDLIGSRSPLLIKLHGVLMLSAWMWMVSTAVLVARHFRQLTLLGHRVWFQVHRAMMVVAVGVTSVAFILPFIYRGGWSKHAGVHPYAGCTVMALMVIQPIMAALRPAVDAPR
ncbi:ferric-chelate reductase 1-like [Diretmus argenteus]